MVHKLVNVYTQL